MDNWYQARIDEHYAQWLECLEKNEVHTAMHHWQEMENYKRCLAMIKPQ